MTRSHIILSAASVAAAIQAVNEIHAEGQMIEVPSRGGGFDLAVSDAMSRSHTQAEIRGSLQSILKGVRLEGILLSEKYADIAQNYMIDSTQDTQNFSTFGCYTNCHSACHGSRGWR